MKATIALHHVLLWTGVAFLANSSAAIAGDFPAKGDFKITYTLTNPAPIKPITTGKDLTFNVSTAIMAAFNEAGEGLLHDMAGRCSAMVNSDNGKKTFESHGFCDYADADGNHVFEKYDYPVQPQALATHGTGTWIGGTGKFEGLTGTFDIHSRRLTSLTDGAYQVIGEKVGSYTIERLAASK